MADKAAVGYIAISVFKYQRGTVFFFFSDTCAKEAILQSGKVGLINHLYLQSFEISIFMRKVFTFGSLVKSWQFTLVSEHIHAIQDAYKCLHVV